MGQLQAEVTEKELKSHAQVVLWGDIKDNPPKALKISRIAMIPHKSKKFWAILNLSYTINLMERRIESLNGTMKTTVPQGAMCQMDHLLNHIIYAYAEAEEDEILFTAKEDVKDGFWRCVAKGGQEWNFVYVLPQAEGEPI